MEFQPANQPPRSSSPSQSLDVRSQPAASGPDPWNSLCRFTDARIALGRAGASWRTQTLLDFRLAHAQARDAVAKAFDADRVEQPLRAAGLETVRLTTAATSREEFLRRPDLGRQLSAPSRQLLTDHLARWADRDLVVMVSDGLSSLATETQAAPTLLALLPLLLQAGWTLSPVFIVPFARVKLQDELGALLRARHALALLGERPGLGSPDSLGAYLTYQPGPAKTDADRNCVSNIRAQGLPPVPAAAKLACLLQQSALQGCSGVLLKVDPPAPTPRLVN
jgi:ethanolamine ammonia-lyase small subunit